jgi:two-component sensor histidine kinase
MEEPMPPATNSQEIDAGAMANHRIANNLSMIAGLVRMQGSSIGESPRPMAVAEVRFMLEELGGRLETVARLHRLLASRRHEAAVDLAGYLRDIAEAVVSSLAFTGAARLRFLCDTGCLVPPERALPLGLIVGELVTNSLKYAHPTGIAGEIRVACRSSRGGGIVIEISDDGVGLPEDFDPLNAGGLGLRLIRVLAKQLGATFAFENEDIGLRFVLQMPAPVSGVEAIAAYFP